jgi:hypothetical protein
LDSFGQFFSIPFHEIIPSLIDKENDDPSVLGTPFRSISDVNIASWKTPLSCERRRPRLGNFDDSPVNKVLGSPRGEDISRIYALRQEVKRLKEFNSTVGREKDQLDELCIAQDIEMSELRAENERLSIKL